MEDDGEAPDQHVTGPSLVEGVADPADLAVPLHGSRIRRARPLPELERLPHALAPGEMLLEP